jgi:hypothetical protein
MLQTITGLYDDYYYSILNSGDEWDIFFFLVEEVWKMFNSPLKQTFRKRIIVSTAT